MTVHCGSFIGHNQQVLTGFSLLGFHFVVDNALPEKLITVEVGDRRLAYDMQDGWTSYAMDGRYRQIALWSSVYFRRSYCAPGQADDQVAMKMRPLPPNYLCYNDVVRSAAFSGIPGWLRLCKQGDCHYRQFEPVEHGGGNGRVLFLTRLYNPCSPEVENEEIAEQRERINRLRISIVTALRKEFGKHALCGLLMEPYALKQAPSLVASMRLTHKPNYIREMKKASVCVSSLGLHDSNGWKFGEYMAAGRAIVTERPVYEVPYASSGSNYLVYDDVDGCIQGIEALLADRNLRLEMQGCNRDYYFKHLRPDKLILDTISSSGIKFVPG